MTEVSRADVRTPGLLPVNSTPLERSIAATTARTFDIPVPLADLMNPDTIPLALLP